MEIRSPEALFYKKMGKKCVRCMLCPHSCAISEGLTGRCRARKNIGGQLRTLTWGKLGALQIDPIEKKPIHFFMPNTMTLSVGSLGCNMNCQFCQNHHLARPPEINRLLQTSTSTNHVPPQQLIKEAMRNDTPSISYTYNEPTVNYEYVLQSSELARDQGIANIIVTNGFIGHQPLQGWLTNVDAMNIDLKCFNEKAYRRLGGRLAAVQQTIYTAAEQVHVEITSLLVTGINDNIYEIEAMARWLATIDENIPLHLSRYFPQQDYLQQATDIDFMEQAYEVARSHLKRVRLGNVPLLK